MKRDRLLPKLILLSTMNCAIVVQTAAGQANPAPASAIQSTVGTVTRINAESRMLSMRTDQGQEFTVTLQADTSYRRVAPGETDLRNAATIALKDVGIGDRVLARGTGNGQTVSASLMVVMSQADLAGKQLAEKADWDKRGISGLVTAISSDSVTVSVRGSAGTSRLVLALAPGAVVRRYAADSVNFADAKVSKLEEIKVGDQLRARGDKSEDGSRLTAVEIVSGTFKTIAGLVLSIDISNREVRIRDLDAKTPVVVKINSDSKVQKISSQVAQSIAARLRPDAAIARGRGERGAGSGGDIQQLLETSPQISLADLKVGDAVVVSSTAGANAGGITAIRLIAGVEAILTTPGTREMSIGAGTLDVGGGGGQ